MDASDNHTVSEPLRLTPKQQRLLDILRDKETEEYPISNWYLGALYTLDNSFNPDRMSQAAQSLRELLEKLPRVIEGSDVQGYHSDFAGMRRQLNERFLKDKESFPEGWKNKTINAHLAKTLSKFDVYLERNQQPNRKERIGKAVATIDPMVNRFSSEIQEMKRKRLLDLWRRLEDFAHHKSEPDEKEFRRCLEDLERTIYDLLAPITAQDQKEIQSILNCTVRSEADIDRIFFLIERRGANYVFFFKQAAETADASWLSHLDMRGYFDNPPDAEPIGEGRVNFPFWWPLHYLAKISKHAPDEVTNLVLGFPKVDNPNVYDDILEIALQLHGQESTKLMPKILQSLKLEHQVWTYQYADLLAHWTKENQVVAALELATILVAFVPDPRDKDKRKRRGENSQDLAAIATMAAETQLEPSPRTNRGEYCEIMSKGVRPLAEKEPYKVACTLINATANMIRLRTHQEGFDKDFDYSEIWCERLVEFEGDYEAADKSLVHTLTFACQSVYEKETDSIHDLDDALRNKHWRIFKRLRQHLYAQYPSEQTKPWIREMILAHEDYHRWEHSYEFQQMIQSACQHFGTALLAEEKRKHIFDCILNGPSKDGFTEEEFKQHQRRFHRKQFRPFVPVLFGEYKSYFQELENESAIPISDEDYPPIRTKSGAVGRRSPHSIDSLYDLTDTELLSVINEWEENELVSEGNSLVEINVEGLARAFQTVFTKSILPDANRLQFWIDNCGRIARPIYVRMMIDGMQTDVKQKNFDRLHEWLTFGEWILSQPNEGSDTDYSLGRQGDESRQNPDWYNSREIVGDFIDSCLEKDLDVPVTARGQIAKLLDMLCTQFDRHLDPNLYRGNLIDKAINSVRGRALRTLAKFGYWLRRHDSATELPEITAILEKRFAPETEHSLTLPEYAILGRDYRLFFTLNESWVTEHKSDFFPQDMLPAWLAAFSSFLHYNPPFERTFDIFRGDFDFALQCLTDLKKHGGSQEKELDIIGRHIKQNDPEEILIDSLSHHLFDYYLWGMYPLKGLARRNDHFSPLEQYFQLTADEREHWANLFYYVGDLLVNTEQLPKDLKDRIIAFFDWRLAEKDPLELQQFTGWLEAECLEAEWRLDAYAKVLDVYQTGDLSIATQVEVLCKLLPDHTARVIECFVKLTDASRHGNIYIYAEEAKTVLKAGLGSDNQEVRQNAERARENLLSVGRSDLLDLDD